MADAWNKGHPSLTTLGRSLAEPLTQLTLGSVEHEGFVERMTMGA